jgi:hypothetical protein
VIFQNDGTAIEAADREIVCARTDLTHVSLRVEDLHRIDVAVHTGQPETIRTRAVFQTRVTYPNLFDLDLTGNLQRAVDDNERTNFRPSLDRNLLAVELELLAALADVLIEDNRRICHH